jgi:hypothetical protein
MRVTQADVIIVVYIVIKIHTELCWMSFGLLGDWIIFSLRDLRCMSIYPWI